MATAIFKGVFSILSAEAEFGAGEGNTTPTTFSLQFLDRSALTAEWVDNVLVVHVAGDCERATLAKALQWLGEIIADAASPGYLGDAKLVTCPSAPPTEEEGLPAQAYAEYNSGSTSERDLYDPDDDCDDGCYDDGCEGDDSVELLLDVWRGNNIIRRKLDLLLSRLPSVAEKSSPAPALSAKTAKGRYDHLTPTEKKKVEEESLQMFCAVCMAPIGSPCHRINSAQTALKHPHPERIRWAMRERMKKGEG